MLSFMAMICIPAPLSVFSWVTRFDDDVSRHCCGRRNQYLASYAREAGASDIQYVPTVVDLDRYGIPLQHSNETFTIGWIGTPWTARYLPAIAPALKEACQGGRARLLLIGSGDIQLVGVPPEVRSWSESTEIENIQSIDVGIMPLPDEPYERGKCGYKLLQYMACGRPVIASPVGVNRQIVEDGVNGFFASTLTDWIHAIEKLRQNHEMRRSMGKAARLNVEGDIRYRFKLREFLRFWKRHAESASSNLPEACTSKSVGREMLRIKVPLMESKGMAGKRCECGHSPVLIHGEWWMFLTQGGRENLQEKPARKRNVLSGSPCG